MQHAIHFYWWTKNKTKQEYSKIDFFFQNKNSFFLSRVWLPLQHNPDHMLDSQRLSVEHNHMAEVQEAIGTGTEASQTVPYAIQI